MRKQRSLHRASAALLLQASLRASAYYVGSDAKLDLNAKMPTVMRRGGGGGRAGGVLTPGQAPPDLPSLLLDSRIVYIGMPLVASVTELIISELLWLNFNQPEKPAYIYINSAGSQSDQQEAVGFESEAFALLDTLAVRALFMYAAPYHGVDGLDKRPLSVLSALPCSGALLSDRRAGVSESGNRTLIPCYTRRRGQACYLLATLSFQQCPHTLLGWQRGAGATCLSGQRDSAVLPRFARLVAGHCRQPSSAAQSPPRRSTWSGRTLVAAAGWRPAARCGQQQADSSYPCAVHPAGDLHSDNRAGVW